MPLASYLSLNNHPPFPSRQREPLNESSQEAAIAIVVGQLWSTKWWATCYGFHKISFRVVKQEVSREGKIQYWINLAAKNCKCFECFLESSNCTPMPYMHTLRIYFVVVTQRRILFCLRKMRGNLSRLIRHTSFNFVSCYWGKSSIHFGRKHNWQSLYVETVAKNCKLLMTS